MTVDLGAARSFYTELFGWELAEGGPDTGGYTMALVDGHSAAGLGPIPPGTQMPTVWTTYLATDDADATAAAIKAAGGAVYQEPFDVMTFGRMGVAADPSGSMFGFWQSQDHHGAEIANVPNTMVWNECLSRDWEAAKAFYASVFGTTYTDMSGNGFEYATIEVDGRTVGGIGAMPAQAPAGVPSNWMVYFDVLDTDATVAKVEQLGGSVMRPASDSPYGRMATLTDPQGGAFAIISSSTTPQ
jgi:predicted enzyme related to lactoylglutathione lyase